MPGGRLTQQERRRIAQGLADGLAYAEIARGLGRPTSTVTREVMRNGGPIEYRSDLAQRVAERRARRRRRTDPGGSPARGGGPDDAALAEYEETFTTLFMRQGLPSMMARVLTCLLTAEEGSLTAAELVARLQVSRASVSKAVAFLEEQGLVRKERDERRRDRYFVDDDVWYRSTIASARGVAALAETARQGVDLLGRGSLASARLENIARFSDFISESILRAAEEARDVLHTKPAEASAVPERTGPDQGQR